MISVVIVILVIVACVAYLAGLNDGFKKSSRMFHEVMKEQLK